MIDIQNQMSQKVGLGTLFVKSYVENKDFEFYKELYERHQFIMGGFEGDKKSVTDFSAKFVRLIESIKKNGFDKNYPIVVSREGVPIDGHHRVSCCLYFGITPTYTVNLEKSILSYNGISWLFKSGLISNCFSQFEKALILQEYSNYNTLYYYNSDDIISDIPLGYFHMVYKKKKYNISIYSIKQDTSIEVDSIHKMLKNDLKDGDFQGPSKYKTYCSVYFLHTQNKLKRKLYEFILKFIK